MKTRFETSEYMKSTGKAPKGKGTWAFATHRNPEVDEMKFFYGTLTEAKKQAKAAFENGATIYILP